MHQCLHFRVSSQLSRHILCSLGFQPNSAWSSGFHHGSHTSNGKCGIAPLMITSKTTHQPKHITRIRFFINSNALIQSPTAKEINREARKLWGFTSSSNMCISQLCNFVVQPWVDAIKFGQAPIMLLNEAVGGMFWWCTEWWNSKMCWELFSYLCTKRLRVMLRILESCTFASVFAILRGAQLHELLFLWNLLFHFCQSKWLGQKSWSVSCSQHHTRQATQPHSSISRISKCCGKLAPMACMIPMVVLA